MDTLRFDQISKRFAPHRLSRRRALQQGTAGLAVAGLAAAGVRGVAAQESSPEASPTAETISTTPFLFLQSFEGGSIAPKDGADGTYTLTLQHALGQTVYFSDRPERIVGVAPTQQFLDGLGFGAENPPNAALVVDTGEGGVDIAVVELTNPGYDAANATATYEVTVLQDFEADVDLQFQEAPGDLATLAASFGSAHLFIDDCADATVVCMKGQTGRRIGWAGTGGTCWNWSSFKCTWCEQNALNARCNEDFADCEGDCWAEAVW